VASNDRLIELAIYGLKAERDKIEREISELQAQIGKIALPALNRFDQTLKSTVRKMSEAGRRRISAAMKLRWARHSLEAKSGKPMRPVVVAKVSLSDAGRKKLSDMMKKRWAEKRKAAKKKS